MHALAKKTERKNSAALGCRTTIALKTRGLSTPANVPVRGNP